MKLAAQLYTIREFTKTPEDIRESLKKISGIGYKYVQVSGFGPIEPQLLKEYLDESGVKCCATHVPLERITDDTDKLIEEHKLLECGYIGLGAMPGEYRVSKESYDKFLQLITPAAKKIADAGLKFMYHNHHFEFIDLGGVSGMEYMATKTSPDWFGFLADFYWVQAGGGMPVQFIERYADRLDVVHFKDMTIVDDKSTMAEVGSGNMDYKVIYESCLKAGVKFAAIEQDECRRNPFESLTMSYNYFKNNGMFIE